MPHQSTDLKHVESPVNGSVKERPILFSGPMVRGLLEGRKTQTRRIVKPQPEIGRGMNCERLRLKDRKGRISLDVAIGHDDHGLVAAMCPYGKPGDRLWVRETFYCDVPHDDEDRLKELYYRADVPSGKFQDAGYWGEPGSFWKPSIFMPRWASRLTLEITNIRVERIQDISSFDIRKEGVSPEDGVFSTFMKLWDDTNGKGAWERNDWCWVIDFKPQANSHV